MSVVQIKMPNNTKWPNFRLTKQGKVIS